MGLARYTVSLVLSGSHSGVGNYTPGVAGGGELNAEVPVALEMFDIRLYSGKWPERGSLFSRRIVWRHLLLS